VPRAKPGVYDLDDPATPTTIFERFSSIGLDFVTKTAKRPPYFMQACPDPTLIPGQFLKRIVFRLGW
jgi:hypothetical protein